MAACHRTSTSDERLCHYRTIDHEYIRPLQHPRAAAPVTSEGSETTRGVISNHGTAKNKRAPSKAQQRTYMDNTILEVEHAHVAGISSAPSNPQP